MEYKMRTGKLYAKLKTCSRFLVFLAFVVSMVQVSHTNATIPDRSTLSAQLQDGRLLTVTGVLGIVHADAFDAPDLSPFVTIFLTDDEGTTFILDLDYTTAKKFDRRRVKVSGMIQNIPTAQGDVQRTLQVTSIRLMSGESESREPLVGSSPWVTILCQFSDMADVEPHPRAWYEGMFVNSEPGLDHYWRQVSYNTVDIAGTIIVGWVDLPNPRSYYVPATGKMTADQLSNLFDDCVGAGDPEVFFPDFTGINLFFNAPLDGTARGGGKGATLDGTNQFWPATLVGTDMLELGPIAHEMGHAFGLDHSSGPAGNVPEYIYVSKWDVMSSAWGTGASPHPDYGRIPPGTIANNLLLQNWLDSNSRVMTVNEGQSVTIWLERLNQPQSDTNYLLVKVPINDSPTHYYTVEARQQVGYDRYTPGDAVIIHEYDEASFPFPPKNDPNDSDNPTALVVDGDRNNNVNDRGARWTRGEVFTDTSHDIRVEVLESGNSAYQVRVSNNALLLKTPTNGSATTQGTPLFTWEKKPNAVRYEIELDTNNPPSISYTVERGLTGVPTRFRPPSPLLNRIYYWRVRAFDAEGNASPWSETWSVTILSPDRSAPQRNRYTTLTPTLTWNRVTWATGYEIQVDDNKNFSSPEYSNSSIPADSLSDTTDALPNGTWYWRVRAHRSNGQWGRWSEVDSFQIDVQ
jgi:M6 family metalloprotease-like protein